MFFITTLVNINFLKAKSEDLEQIIEVVKETISDMKTYGNPQWDDTYPTYNDFALDVERENLYCLKSQNQVLGFAVIDENQPPEYADCNWVNKEFSLCIHRMAIKKDSWGKGLASLLLNRLFCVAKRKGAFSVRTDTNLLNKKMQNLFIRCGFKFVGNILLYGKPGEYVAFERKI